jgi:O-6-methylguanine DNA methyltransferase
VEARRELAEYFSGQRSYFSVPVDLSGLTGFDVSALQVAAAIPYGEVRTYKSIAEQLGSPEAARAVGHAMAINPVPIIIPCHRVIKTDGGLGGYLYGLDVKQDLLDLEQSTPPLVGCASTRIVCYRGCPHEKRIEEAGRVSFRSLAEAEAGGYRPCLICMQAPAIVAQARTVNHPQ